MKVLHFLLATALIQSVAAAPPADPNQRLRDTLKNTILQLRTVETERATLQASQLVNEAKIKELTAEIEKLNKQIAKLTKEAIAEQEVAKKEIDTLKTKQEAQEKQIAQLTEALEKWKAGYNDVVKIAKEREALRAKAASRAVIAERKLAERERQNLELYTTGREILDRLEGFGLGTAVTAREPFIGLTKVKLQNYVQDYGDKLQDNKYNPFAEKEAEKGRLPASQDTAGVEKPAQP
jgi:chromosome segregation ATPase